jgi:release factor glutamine methyltransferase
MRVAPNNNGLDPRLSLIERRLTAAGIPDASSAAARVSRIASARYQLDPSTTFDDQLEMAAAETAAHRSLGRIMGAKKFCGLSIRLADNVYEPCLSSERLVEHAVARTPDPTVSLRVLDLGTGAGNLLLAALREWPNATGVGIDCSSDAVALAGQNATAHGLSARCAFSVGDAHTMDAGTFDVVFSTLPWVPTAQIAALCPEVVLHDPIMALDGGRDGLAHFRRMVTTLPTLLAPSGRAFVQVGYELLPSAQNLFTRAGFNVDTLRDAYGIPMGLNIGVAASRR